MVTAALALAACGSSGGGNATAANGGSSKSVNVWIMDPGSPALQGVFHGYASDFQKLHPGTHINIEFVPWSIALNKFTTSIAGGETPDVAEIGTTWTAGIAATGALEAVPQPPAGKYVSALVNAAMLNGKMYGRPWYAGTRVLIYRKDLLAKAGITSPPATWSQLTSDCAALKAKVPNVSCIGFDGLSFHYYLPLVWQAGGQIAVQNGSSWKSQLDSPQAIQAITWYTNLYKNGYVPKSAVGWDEPQVQQAYINGQIAMYYGFGASYNAVVQTKPALQAVTGTALEPAGPSGQDTSFAGGSHLAVFKSSKNIQLANQFVDFMLEPQELNKYTSAIGFQPGTVSGIMASGIMNDPIRKVFAQQLLYHANTYPASPRWAAVEAAKLFQGEMQKAMLGQETPAQAAANWASKLDQTLNG
jgi:N,N'-diacetylchitobiose transport system substrate-binding protein